jgi:hypothetical protein
MKHHGGAKCPPRNEARRNSNRTEGETVEKPEKNARLKKKLNEAILMPLH